MRPERELLPRVVTPYYTQPIGQPPHGFTVVTPDRVVRWDENRHGWRITRRSTGARLSFMSQEK